MTNLKRFGSYSTKDVWLLNEWILTGLYTKPSVFSSIKTRYVPLKSGKIFFIPAKAYKYTCFSFNYQSKIITSSSRTHQQHHHHHRSHHRHKQPHRQRHHHPVVLLIVIAFSSLPLSPLSPPSLSQHRDQYNHCQRHQYCHSRSIITTIVGLYRHTIVIVTTILSATAFVINIVTTIVITIVRASSSTPSSPLSWISIVQVLHNEWTNNAHPGLFLAKLTLLTFSLSNLSRA